ncbi:twin-arginine translocase subunit TatC [Nocardioides jejuensis]|uniref:Sec-independent protein translocase protein TatC n=1 Tax=Nocardioides jejuensis TaxID=2502782 RepID=A0A4R1BZ94_9ACTN|nr:twin-arginine translocase subunit TatC [Nocardioides jejuensis]TCJ23371.1 twin-arginine translocase subunit TatC [Nocardioides jejuensis]
MIGSGFVRLLSGAPMHPVGADGRMHLSDHFREFRARVLKIALIWIVGFAISLFFFDQIYALINDPYQQARVALGQKRTIPITQGPGAGLMLYLKLSSIATSLFTSPLWLYQVWAFVLPGLHRHEKKWTAVFVVVAGPLFLAGVVLGYLTLPKGLEVLIGFNPHGVTNLLEFNDYITFFSRTLMLFGISFDIPVFVVLLNLAGVVKGKTLGAYRRWMIVGVFVFAAVATPSTDPFTMTAMAVPMVILFLISEVIARINDNRRAARRPNANLSPDEASII